MKLIKTHSLINTLTGEALLLWVSDPSMWTPRSQTVNGPKGPFDVNDKRQTL